jgi:HPt (histidine-containing phosphotransfer) domain-containing protein
MKGSGLSGFLPKPLNISQLYTAFSHYLPGKKHQPYTVGKSAGRPEKLKGIDITVGLQHSNGNELIYKEVLAEFLDIYGDTDKLIDKLYSQKRRSQLKQLLLDLMGLTGTIGAKRLYAAANEMYKLFLYNKLSLMQNFTKEYTEALNELKKSISLYLRDSA